MTSTIGGDDPAHDLSKEEKEELVRSLLEEAKDLMKRGKTKEDRKKRARATEIARRKSKNQEHH
jgi:hypothetical protein